jgi:hypothetical protein
MRIIYLGNPTDYDPHTARLLWRWMNAATGYRGLVVVHPKVDA